MTSAAWTSMITSAIGDIDVQLIRARWRLWHATWASNSEQVDTAMSEIDGLLDRRYELTRPKISSATPPSCDDAPRRRLSAAEPELHRSKDGPIHGSSGRR